jgi:fructose-bisphosphate aldolase, class II
MLTFSQVLLKTNALPSTALPAFTVTDLTDMHAVLEACHGSRTPLVMLTSQYEIDNFGIHFIRKMAEAAALTRPIPVFLVLDHGTSFDDAVRCIANGYSLIMFDGSRLPLEENVRATREIARIAHAAGALAEGEIGHVPGQEGSALFDSKPRYTDPEEAEFFYRETGVDLLAVSFGTAHGLSGGLPQLDCDIVREVRRRTGAPIAMHGGSGVPPQQVRNAIDVGVKKINFSSDLRAAYTAAVRRCSGDIESQTDHMKIFMEARRAVQEVAREKISLVNAPVLDVLA